MLRRVLPIHFTLMIAACLAACSSPESGPAATPTEGLTLHNPVTATPESIAAGKKLFDRLCADCHGAAADGVSAVAAAMADTDVKPSDLTDGAWTHGSSDGEIFVVIRDGLGGNMRGLNGRPGVGPQEMWHMVNYIRSLTRN